MATQIFVNLPVKDLKKSVEFFTKLGYTFNAQFTDENATCMIVSDTIYFMLLVESYMKTFTTKQIVDAKKATEVLLALSCDSKEAVNTLVDKALAAGGIAPKEYPQDLGFMSSRNFEDLDGLLDPGEEEPIDRVSRPPLVRVGGGQRDGLNRRLERPVLAQGAPSAIHRLRTSICWGVRLLPELFGGMSISASSVSIRNASELSSTFPGTTAASPDSSLARTPSWTSSRSFAFRCLSSGPWQAKQLSERIGLTSRAKFTGRGLAGAGFGAASGAASPPHAARKRPPRSTLHTGRRSIANQRPCRSSWGGRPRRWARSGSTGTRRSGQGGRAVRGPVAGSSWGGLNRLARRSDLPIMDYRGLHLGLKANSQDDVHRRDVSVSGLHRAQ